MQGGRAAVFRIRRRGGGGRKETPLTKITLKDVASVAGVSVATVSYVLNGTGSVSVEVAERVRAVVDRLGYRPNSVAQAMRTGRTATLGLILPDLLNPFFPGLARSVDAVARELGYCTFLADTRISPEVEADVMRNFVQRGVDGVIWFPATQRDTFAPFRGRLPIVVVDRDLAGYDLVLPDHWRGGELQAEHLLAHGRTRIGLLNGPQSVDNMRLRRDGSVAAIAGRGTVVWEFEANFDARLNADILAALARREVDAIIAGNDLIALSAMQALNGMGQRVPADVSVVGFDDIGIARFVAPALSSVRIELDELGELAVHRLVQLITAPAEPPVRRVVDVRLMGRDSVAAPEDR